MENDETGLPAPGVRETSHKERLAGVLALMLFGLFAIEMVAGITAIFTCPDLDRVKDIFSIILPPTTALLGSVAGFYYGASR